MKKFMLFLTCTFSTVCLYAANDPVTLKSGETSAMKSVGTGIVQFDYSKAQILDGKETTTWDVYAKSKGEKQSKWELAVKNTEGAFIKKLEKKVKPMKLATEGEGDYKLIIRFTKIDFGDTAAGVLSSLTVFGSSKAGGAKFTGEVELIDNTGKSLCVLSFTEAKGTRSDSNQLRFTVGMLDLANYICKALK